jgi:hypothetical protein
MVLRQGQNTGTHSAVRFELSFFLNASVQCKICTPYFIACLCPALFRLRNICAILAASVQSKAHIPFDSKGIYITLIV